MPKDMISSGVLVTSSYYFGKLFCCVRNPYSLWQYRGPWINYRRMRAGSAARRWVRVLHNHSLQSGISSLPGKDFGTLPTPCTTVPHSQHLLRSKKCQLRRNAASGTVEPADCRIGRVSFRIDQEGVSTLSTHWACLQLPSVHRTLNCSLEASNRWCNPTIQCWPRLMDEETERW